jgi:excisionase family DNA binding protein
MPERPRKQTSALFVRLPVEQAEKLSRAAFELRIPKQELVNTLVERYVDPRSPSALAKLGASGKADPHDRRVVVEMGADTMAVGRHSFRPNEPSEVLSLADVSALLDVSEAAVEALARAGEIPARQIEEQWRFSRRAVLDWLAGSEDLEEGTS